MILRRVAIVLIALQCLSTTQAFAAVPTAKPHPKVTTVNKKTATKKAVPAKKQVATTKKKSVTPAKKKVVKRYIYHPRKRKPVEASPSPSWPPKGFTSVGSAFARVPTGSELVGILSAMNDGATKVSSCAIDPKRPTAPAFACAAILVGSTQRCTWWKVSASLSGIDPADPAGRVNLGDITVMQPGAEAKSIQTIFLVSPVPLQTGVRFSAIHALCGIGPSTEPVPSTTFAPTPSGTPTPSPSNS